MRLEECIRRLVEAERKRRKLGVRELARAAKMASSTTCGLLNGRRKITLNSAQRLAKAMGCELIIAMQESVPDSEKLPYR